MIGGADSDDLRGGESAHRLVGGAGNDTIYSGLGADVIDGGLGQKDKWVVDFQSLSPNDVSVVLLSGNVDSTVDLTGAQVKNIESLTIDTGAGNDLVDTSAVKGNDDIETGDGDDYVTPGLGVDRVELGNGIDTLILNYTTLTADIQHLDRGYGGYMYQDGFIPTSSPANSASSAFKASCRQRSAGCRTGLASPPTPLPKGEGGI